MHRYQLLRLSIHAFDGTHEQAVVHPSGPVAAAILAMSGQANRRLILLAFLRGGRFAPQ